MDRTYESAMALASRAAGPLAAHLGPWVRSLIDKQYVAAVVYVKSRHAAAFDRWLAALRTDLEDLSEVHLAQYQDRRRRLRRPVCVATRQQERRELVHLLRDLRELGVCSTARVATTPSDDLAADFGHHLQHQQGLASSSIERYRKVAEQFLVERFGRGAVDLSTVGAADVVGFVQRQSKRLTPPAMKCVVNGLRSFLRYAQYCGNVAPELVAAVPAVASWACTPAVPKAISAEHAQRAIDGCDATTATGLRDRAVLLLLARLGLRAREVIALRLEDCDWDRGQLLVRGKGRRECILPMPVDVGEAIASYLERGRPACRDRHLFLRSMAPVCGFLQGADGIGSIVRYALRRAEVDAPHSGSHQFRHALAVRMLQGGASLPEIGEVLRHRSPQSTSIYARVDIEALRTLAVAWPGAAQ
ncbi:tyrosine-type recombinase/integrase [Pelomonas sp. Root1217]|uniref:tyrosine-type recombinase/integrase n=1 Tax=Pelomonas sp. Root1217 TaxID=1736430 RepID=UPI0012FC78C8|nr:tyrosine-type recombinase/integrase [Pelomonas sp. Root1217]